jgi:hypothetical protein
MQWGECRTATNNAHTSLRDSVLRCGFYFLIRSVTWDNFAAVRGCHGDGHLTGAPNPQRNMHSH